MMQSCVHISVSIARSPAEVAAFVRDVWQLPRWAKGLCTGVRQEGSDWKVQTLRGEVTLRFAEDNPFGVLDHEIVSGSERLLAPMRVLANSMGSELVFSLFRLPDMSDEDFRADEAMVRQDLMSLRALLEGQA